MATHNSLFADSDVRRHPDGIAVSTDGLVFATEDRATRVGRALARVESIALRFMGEAARAELGKIAVDWMPFERYSLNTKATAAQAAKAAGHSDRFILEHVWQLTPEEIAIEEQAKAADQLAAAALTGTRPTNGAVA